MQIMIPAVPVEAMKAPAGQLPPGDGAFAVLVLASQAQPGANGPAPAEVPASDPHPENGTMEDPVGIIATDPSLPAGPVAEDGETPAPPRLIRLPAMVLMAQAGAPADTADPDITRTAAASTTAPPVPGAAVTGPQPATVLPSLPAAQSDPAARDRRTSAANTLAVPASPVGPATQPAGQTAPELSSAVGPPATPSDTRPDTPPALPPRQAAVSVTPTTASLQRPGAPRPPSQGGDQALPVDAALAPEQTTPASPVRSETAASVVAARPEGSAPAIAATRQIAVAVATLPDGGTEIRLDPAELGNVRLSLQATDSAITLMVHADRPETADLIRRNLESLAQDLRALGYQEVGVSVSGGDGGQGPAAGAPGTGAGNANPDSPGGPTQDPRATSTETTPSRPGGLDLRL